MHIGAPKPEGPSGSRKGVDGARGKGDASGIRAALGLGGSEAPPDGGAPAPGLVSLSGEVDDVRRVADLARGEPELRPDVVEQARKDLDAGLLTADAEELAGIVARDL